MKTYGKIVAVVVFIVGMAFLFLLILSGDPPKTVPVSSLGESESELMMRGVVLEVGDTTLRVGDMTFYLYLSGRDEARKFLNKEAVIEYDLVVPKDVTGCVGTVRGVFDPTTWIAPPDSNEEGICGSMRLFGVRLEKVESYLITVVPSSVGKRWIFEVSSRTTWTKLREAEGKRISVAGVFRAESEHVELRDVRILDE